MSNSENNNIRMENNELTVLKSNLEKLNNSYCQISTDNKNLNNVEELKNTIDNMNKILNKLMNPDNNIDPKLDSMEVRESGTFTEQNNICTTINENLKQPIQQSPNKNIINDDNIDDNVDNNIDNMNDEIDEDTLESLDIDIEKSEEKSENICSDMTTTDHIINDHNINDHNINQNQTISSSIREYQKSNFDWNQWKFPLTHHENEEELDLESDSEDELIQFSDDEVSNFKNLPDNKQKIKFNESFIESSAINLSRNLTQSENNDIDQNKKNYVAQKISTSPKKLNLHHFTNTISKENQYQTCLPVPLSSQKQTDTKSSTNSYFINQFTNKQDEQFNEKNISNDNKNISNDNKKITINVGGKKFSLKKKILKYLNINYNRLQKTIKNDKNILYFLDRDPYYFSKIMALFIEYGLDKNKLLEQIDNYSEQFLSELCFYDLIDKKFLPKPKLRLKRCVKFTEPEQKIFLSRHDEIVKIVAGDQLFEISAVCLTKCNHFDNKLKLSRGKRFYLSDTDPQIFRYVLNLLRTGELYINNADVLQMLDRFGIEYDKLESKKIDNTIVSCLHAHNLDAIDYQLLAYSNTIGLGMIDNKYYHPTVFAASYGMENFNTIMTESRLSFDTEINFNLTSVQDFGECIEDLLLCVDIPALKATENFEYIEQLEYKIVEYIKLICDDKSGEKILMETNNNLLYLYPLIFTSNPNDYREMMELGQRKVKLIYQNDLIDIHRFIIPLFLFEGKQNHLPVRKMRKNGVGCHLIVKLASLKKIFKNKIKNIPLLNVCLLANYINLAPNMNIATDQKDNLSKQIPINIELKNYAMMYLYNHTHMFDVTIQPSTNPVHDNVVISLGKFGLIKDFFFTILTKEDVIANRIDTFTDELIEIEIMYLQKKQEPPHESLVYHSKLDAIMLNSYIPIKQLKHKLPSGIYYYSFSSDSTQNKILGGLPGNNFLLNIKVKKMNGMIKFYAREYVKQIF